MIDQEKVEIKSLLQNLNELKATTKVRYTNLEEGKLSYKVNKLIFNKISDLEEEILKLPELNNEDDELPF